MKTGTEHFLPGSSEVANVSTARALAQDWLGKEDSDSEFELALSDCADEASGVFFFDYNSVEFLKYGKFNDMLVGHGPILVDKATGLTAMPFGSGEVRNLPEMANKFKQLIMEGRYS